MTAVLGTARRPGLPTVRYDGAAALDALDGLAGLWAATATPVTARGVWLRAAATSDLRWTPVLLVVEREGAPVAAAPLAVRRERGVRTVRLLDLGHADHARLPAGDAAAARELAKALVRLLRAGGPWRLHLAQLPADDPVLAELGRTLGLRWAPGAGCPLAVLDPQVPFLSQLTGNGRRSLRAGANRLATDGRGLDVRWSTGTAALADLPRLQALRRGRDHAAGRASEMDDPAGLAFHTRLVTDLAHDDVLELLTLEVDGALAAYDLLVRDGDVLRVLDGRVAPGLERYGLGWQADAEVLRRAWADPGVTAVDWLRGEQQSKQRTAVRIVTTVQVRAESSPRVAAVDRLAGAVREAFLDLMRRSVPPARRHALRALLRRG